ncbi:MAG: hypothetical protein ABFQ95_01545 [Pseudomonadota bacterium]
MYFTVAPRTSPLNGLSQRSRQKAFIARKFISGFKLQAMQLSLVILAGVVLTFLLTKATYAITTGVLQQEVTDTEDLISGGYLRIGLFALCGIAAGMSIMKQNVMGLVIAGIGAFFVYLMKGWINTNFAAVI